MASIKELAQGLGSISRSPRSWAVGQGPGLQPVPVASVGPAARAWPGRRRRTCQRLPGLEPHGSCGPVGSAPTAFRCRPTRAAARARGPDGLGKGAGLTSQLLAKRTQGRRGPLPLGPSPRPAAPCSDPGQRFPSGLCPHVCWPGGGCLPAVSAAVGACRGGSRGPSRWPSTRVPHQVAGRSPVGTELQALAVCWAHGGSQWDFLDFRSGCGRGGRCRDGSAPALLLCGPDQGTGLSGPLVACGVHRVTWVCLDLW